MTVTNVTKTFLPPIEDYEQYIKEIWQSGQVTNQGPLVKQFEQEIRDILKIEYFHFVANGTLAIQLALRALEITEGEVITTPFTYIATASAILWERCTPVFVDIEPNTFCIDPDKIEAAITKKTKAILPVHVFGKPCDVRKIDHLAQKHNLKVVYDAAHAFGVSLNNTTLLKNGDISICSFHATKPFHTIEGGGLIIKDKDVSEKVELMKRFGHDYDEHKILGINTKASEFNAAMGLCNLKYLQSITNGRKKASEQYDLSLNKRFRRTDIPEGLVYNYAYYPIVFNDEAELLKVVDKLQKEDIFPRRYFYPSLNTVSYMPKKDDCPIAEDISKRILCLPLYDSLSSSKISQITGIINTYT